MLTFETLKALHQKLKNESRKIDDEAA